VSRIKVNINPDVLKWAREEAGYHLNEIAEKLSLSENEYSRWEEEGKNIPFGKLKIAATSFKRQIPVFFLPNVPEKVKKPKDFRNLKPSEKTLSKKVLLTLRRASHLQQIANELKGENFWREKENLFQKINVEKIELTNQRVINKLRKELNISIEDQIKWKSGLSAYKKWRSAVEEKLGILVFQFPMPMEELQGFCLTEGLPKIIVTNSKHSYYGRLFTIFHELAHIIRNQSGMCLIDLTSENNKLSEEFECNSFAGQFLVPANSLIPSDDLEEIRKYANNVNVSREVYLRRLKEEGLIQDRIFYTLLGEIKESYKNQKKRSGYVPPITKSKASRGETFFSMIIEAVNNNQLNYSDAANALDLRVNTLLNEL